MRRLLMASCMLSLALSVTANANVITNYSPTLNQTAFDSQGLLVLTLPQFDSSLGTLTDATLQIMGITQPQFQVINLGPVAGTAHGFTVVSYVVTGPGVSGLSAGGGSGDQTVSVGAGLGNIASSPAPSPIFFNPSVALIDFAAVTGPGSVALSVKQTFATTGTNDTIGANLGVGGTGSANFLLDITYTFDPIPEPFSLAVLGSGILGLGLIRRRRT